MTALNPLHKLWLTETVRLREEHAGPLEDLEANRLARAAGGDLPTRIQQRALHLAERDGLTAALTRWLQGARLALVLLAVVAVVSGAGLAFAALGNGVTPVNVFWALGSLLGLNLILLISWALGLLFAGEHSASLGRLWLWLSEKLARDAKAAQLAPALLLLLQRQKLNRWAVGMLVNSLWLLALLSAMLILLTLLATRRYGFVWETTILGADTFVAVTQALGRLPALLGFNVPTVEMIRASGDSALNIESARQAWAAWLVGVLLVYGLLPRLILALLCLWRWKRGRAALRLDLNLPGYSQLRERLMPSSERLGVKDAAPEQLHHVTGDQVTHRQFAGHAIAKDGGGDGDLQGQLVSGTASPVGLDKIERHAHQHNQANNQRPDGIARQRRNTAGHQQHQHQRVAKMRQKLQHDGMLQRLFKHVEPDFFEAACGLSAGETSHGKGEARKEWRTLWRMST